MKSQRLVPDSAEYFGKSSQGEPLYRIIPLTTEQLSETITKSIFPIPESDKQAWANVGIAVGTKINPASAIAAGIAILLMSIASTYAKNRKEIEQSIQSAVDNFQTRNNRLPTPDEIVIADASTGQATTITEFKELANIQQALQPDIKPIGEQPTGEQVTVRATPTTGETLVPPTILQPPITITPGIQPGALGPTGSTTWKEPVVMLPGTRFPIPRSIIEDRSTLQERTGIMIAAAQRVITIARPYIDLDDVNRIITQIGIDEAVKQAMRAAQDKRLSADVSRALYEAYQSYLKQKASYDEAHAKYAQSIQWKSTFGSADDTLVKAATNALIRVSPESKTQIKTATETQTETQTKAQEATQTQAETETQTETETETEQEQETTTETEQAATREATKEATREAERTATSDLALKTKVLLPEIEDKKKKKSLLGEAPITWKQGFVWYTIYPPYKSQKDIKITKTPPKNAKVANGVGSAYKTIQSLGGDADIFLRIDMGAFDIQIENPKAKAGREGTIRYTRDTKRQTTNELTARGIRMSL